MEIGPTIEELLQVLQDPHALAVLLDTSPIPSRWMAGALGAILVVAGAHFYRLAVIAPGFLLGTVAARTLIALDDPAIIAVVVVGSGLLGALVFYYLERLALALIGAVVGAQLTAVLWPLVAGTAPWWGPLVGSFFGSLAFPKVFRSLLRPLTALIGAVLLASCFGQGHDLLVVGGLALVGVIFQSAVL